MNLNVNAHKNSFHLIEINYIEVYLLFIRYFGFVLLKAVIFCLLSIPEIFAMHLKKNPELCVQENSIALISLIFSSLTAICFPSIFFDMNF